MTIHDPADKAPFSAGDWVSPIDKTHPRYRVPGKVQTCSFQSNGYSGVWIVRVAFGDSRLCRNNVWSFHSTDVKMLPSEELASLLGEAEGSSSDE